MNKRKSFLLGSLVLAHSVGFCQTRPAVSPVVSGATAGPSTTHPWQALAPNTAAEAYFTNLENGASIQTPFVATFGLASSWGLASAASPVAGKSGHHHLLINRDLPLDFTQAIPFSNQYIHFGQGQMEAVLTLEPGTYTLRLLLADNRHIPQFVHSKPLNITVTRRNWNVDPKSLVKKQVALLNTAPNGVQKVPFKLQFQAFGLNVAHISQKQKDTGHFRLTLTPQGNAKPAEMSFTSGQTEVWLSPPVGVYTAKLDFVANANPGQLLVGSASAVLRVE